MNHFGFYAHGAEFDVDAFLSSTPLVPTFVYRRGDVKRYSCIGTRHVTSGLELLLGDGRSIPFHRQDDIATAYIATHRESLRALVQFPGVESCSLSLQHNARYGRDTVAFGLGLSSRLMWQCLDIGYGFSFFCTLVHPPEPDEYG